MVFFNDPLPCPDGPLRAVRMAVAMRERVGELVRGVAADAATTSRFGVGIAQGYATLGRIGFEGRSDYAAIGTRHQPRRPAVRPGGRAGQILVSQRVQAAADGRRRDASRSADLTLAGFSRPVRGLRRASASTRPRCRRDQHRAPAASRRPRRARRGPSATRASTALQQRLVRDRGARMRLNERGRVGRRRRLRWPVDPRATGRARSIAGLRGAVPVPAPAAAPAAAADRLRDVDAGRRRRSSTTTSRLLARRHPVPCPRRGCTSSPRRRLRAAAQREAARAAAGASPRIRRLIPDRELCHLVPYNTTAARARPRRSPSGSRCTAPTRGARRSAPRPAAGGCSPRRPSGTRSASRTSPRWTTSSTRSPTMRAARADVHARPLVKLNEGVSGAGNALVDLRGPAGARRMQTERGGAAGAGGAMAFEARGPRRFDAVPAAQLASNGVASSRSGSRGRSFRSPSVQLRVTPLGEVELLSTHDQLLGGPSGQSYLGCRFPADFAYARAISDDAPEDRRAARARGRARPVRDRLRRRARGRGVDGRTRSSSTSARAARPIRSSPCSS